MWGLDEIGQYLLLGSVVCSIFAATGFYRHHTIDPLIAFYVFLAVMGGYLGIKLLLAGLKGDIADIPPAVWRLYLAGAGMMAFFTALKYVVLEFKELFKNSDQKDDKDSN